MTDTHIYINIYLQYTLPLHFHDTEPTIASE